VLQNAIEVNIQWQSEYPVIRAQVTAGDTSTDIALDPYDDNIKNAYGYHGETSLMVPVDSTGFYGNYISYVVYVEDDAGRQSRRISGRTKLSSNMAMDRNIDRTDDLTREFIDGTSKKKQGTDMIEAVQKVMERHDTPPTINALVVNRFGTGTVSFFSQALDDKGLQKITLKIFNDAGALMGEEERSDLGTIWEGTTQTFSLGLGRYTVVIQATDTAGNTSPEESTTFYYCCRRGDTCGIHTPGICNYWWCSMESG
jgi:hypothetical protein